MMELANIESLVGKVITRIYADDYNIIFKCHNDEWLALNAYGDCCSRSWIENIEIIPGAVGSTVLNIIENYMGKEYDPEHDCLQSYQTIIRTGRGDIVIEYRNSSNGYYGGSLEKTNININKLPALIAEMQDPDKLLKEVL